MKTFGNIFVLLIALILGYFIMLGIYSVIAFTIARLRYTRAASGIRQYARELNRLGRTYREEDRVLSGMDAGEDEEA